jgi:hypothetical protein
VTDLIAELLRRSRWKAVGSGARALVADVTTVEAHALRSPPARQRVEVFVRELQEHIPKLDGLLMFVRDDRRQILGFGELRITDDGFVWDGPHLMNQTIR